MGGPKKTAFGLDIFVNFLKACIKFSAVGERNHHIEKKIL